MQLEKSETFWRLSLGIHGSTRDGQIGLSVVGLDTGQGLGDS